MLLSGRSLILDTLRICLFQVFGICWRAKVQVTDNVGRGATFLRGFGESLPEEAAAAAGGVSHSNTKVVHRWPGGDGVSGSELGVRGLSSFSRGFRSNNSRSA